MFRPLVAAALIALVAIAPIPPAAVLAAAPPNDAFAAAAPVAALPFGATADLAEATLEAGEPTPSCAFGGLTGTVWYAYTPAADGSITAHINGPFPSSLAAYTGPSPAGLSQVACAGVFGPMTFRANAGVTYYFQVGGQAGQAGPLLFNLEATPAPVAGFFFFPGDPAAAEAVQFFNSSFDPGGLGVRDVAWDFGDGATATGHFATHAYAADGDYTARIAVTTFDGRTAASAQPIRVRTHDVAIVKFGAPQAAAAGQTRQVSVGLANARVPETARVDLYRSVPGGYQLVGSLTQVTPVRAGNRTTDFAFSYTFTGEDAAVGKVTFKAVASLVGARDALPADNEAIASPTKVSR